MSVFPKKTTEAVMKLEKTKQTTKMKPLLINEAHNKELWNIRRETGKSLYFLGDQIMKFALSAKGKKFWLK